MNADNKIVTEDLINKKFESTDGQKLSDYIQDKQRTLNDNETVYLALQLADTIDTQNTNRVYYEDILPENILIQKDGIINIVGTDSKSGRKDDKTIEICCIGRIMYYALAGSMPDEAEISDDKPFYPRTENSLTNKLWSLIGDCIDLDNTKNVKDLLDLKQRLNSLEIEPVKLQIDSYVAEDIFVECNIKKKSRIKGIFHRKDAVVISICILVVIGTIVFSALQEYGNNDAVAVGNRAAIVNSDADEVTSSEKDTEINVEKTTNKFRYTK